MGPRFFIKRFPKYSLFIEKYEETNNIDKVQGEQKKNKKNKKKDDMNTYVTDKIKQAEETLINMEREVKVVKKEKGLIERTESSKIILTEDNRQLLVD